jgi:hypothetical protein
MEADLHSQGSISAVHEFEVAEYSDHGMPLGTAISLPVDDVLARMSPKTCTEDALLDLYLMLLKARSPLYLFDKIVGFIEKHAGHTFQKGVTLPHQETLIKRMQQKHNVPPPVSIPVVLENGTKGTAQYHR